MRTALHRVQLYLLLLFILVGATWQVDRLLLTNEPMVGPAPTADSTPESRAVTPGRVFVFFIDSLAYRLAIDPQAMPTLTSLAARGVQARVRPSRDATTVSSARAMFTGRDHFTILSFVDNFTAREKRQESLFAQLHGAGQRAVVFSDHTFRQFGDTGIEHHHYVGAAKTEVADQVQATRRALRGFVDGDHALTVAHVMFTDHAAHVGVGSDQYRAAFRRADDLIGEIARALPPDASLFVVGDHGHDEAGRHMVGMDVPTYVLCLGPRFRPGVTLKTLPITDIRFFASWALGVALPDTYPSGRHPAALAHAGALPTAWAVAHDALGQSDDGRDRAARRGVWDLRLIILLLGILAALWLATVRAVQEPLRAPLWLTATAWAVAVTLFVEGLVRVVPAGLGVVGGGAALVAFARSRGGARREWLWVILPVLGALVMHGWGHMLGSVRSDFHSPHIVSLGRAWGLAMLLAVLVAWRWGALRPAWLLFGVPFVLSYHTLFKYGAMGVMAQAWIAWALLVTLDAPRLRGSNEVTAAPTRRFMAVLRPLGIFLLVQPFAFPESFLWKFHYFSAWMSWLVPYWPHEWLVVGVVAKILIFWRPGLSARVAAVAACVGLGLTALQMGWIDAAHQGMPLGIGLMALAAWYAGRRHAPELSHVLWLGATLLAFYYSVRIAPVRWFWADLLLAALSLSGRIVAGWERPQDRTSGYAFLLALAVLAAGWTTIAWSAQDLEWHFLYDWLDAATVERRVGWVTPLILARFALPVIAARIILARELGPLVPAVRQMIWLLGGAKICSLILMISGLAVTVPATNVHLEAVQQCALLVVLMCGLL